MDIKPIQSATIQDQVYAELEKAIVSGRIPPGEKITIEGMAKLLKVSLMPVRVALQKLEAGGFVIIGKNRRILVNELTESELDEILELRLMLECRAGEKACRLRTEESVKELEELYKEMIKGQDEENYLLVNRRFHNAIYRQAGSPILLEMISSMWQRVSPYLHLFIRNREDWRTERYDHHHQEMLEALRGRDPERMCRWLTEDLTEAAKMMHLVLVQIRENGAAGS